MWDPAAISDEQIRLNDLNTDGSMISKQLSASRSPPLLRSKPSPKLSVLSIVRSNPFNDVRPYVEFLWTTRAHMCRTIYTDIFPRGTNGAGASHKEENDFLSQYFTQHDILEQSPRFLKFVLFTIAVYNDGRVIEAAGEWKKAHADYFEDEGILSQMLEMTAIRLFFDEEDMKKMYNDKHLLERIMQHIQQELRENFGRLSIKTSPSSSMQFKEVDYHAETIPEVVTGIEVISPTTLVEPVHVELSVLSSLNEQITKIVPSAEVADGKQETVSVDTVSSAAEFQNQPYQKPICQIQKNDNVGSSQVQPHLHSHTHKKSDLDKRTRSNMYKAHGVVTAERPDFVSDDVRNKTMPHRQTINFNRVRGSPRGRGRARFSLSAGSRADFNMLRNQSQMNRDRQLGHDEAAPTSYPYMSSPMLHHVESQFQGYERQTYRQSPHAQQRMLVDNVPLPRFFSGQQPPSSQQPVLNQLCGPRFAYAGPNMTSTQAVFYNQNQQQVPLFAAPINIPSGSSRVALRGLDPNWTAAQAADVISRIIPMESCLSVEHRAQISFLTISDPNLVGFLCEKRTFCLPDGHVLQFDNVPAHLTQAPIIGNGQIHAKPALQNLPSNQNRMSPIIDPGVFGRLDNMYPNDSPQLMYGTGHIRRADDRRLIPTMHPASNRFFSHQVPPESNLIVGISGQNYVALTSAANQRPFLPSIKTNDYIDTCLVEVKSIDEKDIPNDVVETPCRALLNTDPAILQVRGASKSLKMELVDVKQRRASDPEYTTKPQKIFSIPNEDVFTEPSSEAITMPGSPEVLASQFLHLSKRSSHETSSEVSSTSCSTHQVMNDALYSSNGPIARFTAEDHLEVSQNPDCVDNVEEEAPKVDQSTMSRQTTNSTTTTTQDMSNLKRRPVSDEKIASCTIHTSDDVDESFCTAAESPFGEHVGGVLKPDVERIVELHNADASKSPVTATDVQKETQPPTSPSSMQIMPVVHLTSDANAESEELVFVKTAILPVNKDDKALSDRDRPSKLTSLSKSIVSNVLAIGPRQTESLSPYARQSQARKKEKKAKTKSKVKINPSGDMQDDVTLQDDTAVDSDLPTPVIKPESDTKSSEDKDGKTSPTKVKSQLLKRIKDVFTGRHHSSSKSTEEPDPVNQGVSEERHPHTRVDTPLESQTEFVNTFIKPDISKIEKPIAEAIPDGSQEITADLEELITSSRAEPAFIFRTNAPVDRPLPSFPLSETLNAQRPLGEEDEDGSQSSSSSHTLTPADSNSRSSSTHSHGHSRRCSQSQLQSQSHLVEPRKQSLNARKKRRPKKKAVKSVDPGTILTISQAEEPTLGAVDPRARSLFLRTSASGLVPIGTTYTMTEDQKRIRDSQFKMEQLNFQERLAKLTKENDHDAADLVREEMYKSQQKHNAENLGDILLFQQDRNSK